MAKREYPASKTQLRAAETLGIDVSDGPGYTTLGQRLEAAGWDFRGAGPQALPSMDETRPEYD